MTKTIQIPCKKWQCSIVVKNFPDGLPAKVEKFAVRYLLYYEYGDAIRAGKRVIDWAEEKEKKPRGPVVMKDATVARKAQERAASNPALDLQMAAQSTARRKGISYAAAKIAVMLDWNCDAAGVPYTVENPRPEPDQQIIALRKQDAPEEDEEPEETEIPDDDDSEE